MDVQRQLVYIYCTKVLANAQDFNKGTAVNLHPINLTQKRLLWRNNLKVSGTKFPSYRCHDIDSSLRKKKLADCSTFLNTILQWVPGSNQRLSQILNFCLDLRQQSYLKSENRCKWQRP